MGALITLNWQWITGAGSAIAALLAQWAHADGATCITGIYRSRQRRNWLRYIGVRPVAENNAAEVEACARQADIIFDAVGGSLGSTLLSGMRSGTEFVSYGLLSGQPIIPSTKNMASHRRFHLRDILRDMEPAAWQESFHLLWPRLRVAKMHDTQIFPIERWRDALDAFNTPGRSQKPLLKLDGITTLS